MTVCAAVEPGPGAGNVVALPVWGQPGRWLGVAGGGLVLV